MEYSVFLKALRLGALKPSFLETTIALQFEGLCSYRLFLFLLSCCLWSINVWLCFSFSFKSSVRQRMRYIVFSGLLYCCLNIFVEHATTTFFFHSLSVLCLIVYAFRMHTWGLILSQSVGNEIAVPNKLTHVSSFMNFFCRVCFTYGLLRDFHLAFQYFALAVIIVASIVRSFCSYLSTPECRNLQSQLPCLVLIFSLCITFGREIIPEREVCETILTLCLISLPYLHENPLNLSVPLTQLPPQKESDPETISKPPIPHSETSRREDPKYRRNMTVLKLYYFLEEVRRQPSLNIEDSEDESSYDGEAVAISSVESETINISRDSF